MTQITAHRHHHHHHHHQHHYHRHHHHLKYTIQRRKRNVLEVVGLMVAHGVRKDSLQNHI